jgi:MFS superfamily sulfate permease-like transporter
VRSSANNSAGAKSKMSAIIHGVLLLISVLAVPVILNKIPLATLATILILDINGQTGDLYSLLAKGKYQFIPFIATLVAVVTTDLLKGVLLGIVISIIFYTKGNLKELIVLRKKNTLTVIFISI